MGCDKETEKETIRVVLPYCKRWVLKSMQKLGKNRIKKWFFLVVGPQRGRGGKTPLTTKQKKWPEPHETQEKWMKKI